MLVTHDPRVAATADRMLGMRDGTIIEDMRLDGGRLRPDVLRELAGWEA